MAKTFKATFTYCDFAKGLYNEKGETKTVNAFDSWEAAQLLNREVNNLHLDNVKNIEVIKVLESK